MDVFKSWLARKARDLREHASSSEKLAPMIGVPDKSGVKRAVAQAEAFEEALEKYTLEVDNGQAIPSNVPTFTLSARDKFAPGVIRLWITLAEFSRTPRHKILSAERILSEFTAYQREHGAKVPD